MVTRRNLLTRSVAVGATATLTGCLWDAQSTSSLSLHLERVPRDELGQQRVDDVADLTPRERDVFEAGRTNGTVASGRKPVESSVVIRRAGTSYAVTVRADGTETGTRPVLEATAVSTANGSVGNPSNLSESDGRTYRCAIAGRERGDANPCVVIYGGDESAFRPEPRFRYVERGDEGYYRLESSERTITLDRYRYSFDRVAETRSAFADYAAAELLAIDFTDENLATERRDILETAADEGVYEESPPPYSAALEGLVDRVDGSTGGGANEVYVRFDDRYFLAHTQQFWDG